VLIVGVLSTSLLGAFLLLSTGERQRFARLLSERTRERDRIWQACEDLLGVSNFDGYFTSVNPAWTKTLACLAALVLGGSGPLAIDGRLTKRREVEHR
jgi:hypothetical protein